MKRKTVAVNCETIVPKINENGWSDASFSRLVRKYPSWFSEVKRGRNLPSPEEAARMCVLLKTTPDEILVEQNDIDLVNALLDNEMAKEKTPDPKIEGVDDKIAQFIRSASAEELTEISRYIEYLESKRGKS